MGRAGAKLAAVRAVGLAEDADGAAWWWIEGVAVGVVALLPSLQAGHGLVAGPTSYIG